MINTNHTFNIATAPKKNSFHWTLGTVTWAELIEWMEKPAKTKECGNYVLGTLQETTTRHPNTTVDCTDLHRTKMAIVDRGALTLDVDHAEPGFAEKVAALPYATILHTTYSSTSDEPRYRLIVPLSRNVAPDEYHTAAASVMQELGEASFDPGSVQPERYMFRPAESVPGTFWYEVHEGPIADVETLLKDFQSDLSLIPLPKPSKKKKSPFEYLGTMGYFNQAYENVEDLIEEYELPYEQAEGRWKLKGASAAAGMGEVAPGLWYSHHANDPAAFQTCSAFDLVRLHMFGHLDEDAKPGTPPHQTPSALALLDVAVKDPRVLDAKAAQNKAETQSDFDDKFDVLTAGLTFDDSGDTPAPEKRWTDGFAPHPRTLAPLDVIGNWDLIRKNDPVMTGLYFNELTLSIETERDLPWRKMEDRKAFERSDELSFSSYIERTYQLKASQIQIEKLLADGPRVRRVNMVRDYLSSLTWDGRPRLEECLPGVVPSPASRLSARKSLVAAVARMFEPGVKWDHMLVIVGNEGLGKSHWIEKMSRGYSRTLGRIDSKETLQAMQGAWIMVSDEGHSMKKADFDAQKEFLTRTTDNFRLPYEKDSLDYKRRFVIWGTTNDPVSLKKQQGNRRFLMVTATEKVDFEATLTDEYIDQVWAEAVHLYRAGERLWLTAEETALVEQVRDEHTEENAYVGMTLNYLNTLFPDNWDSLSLSERQDWLFDPKGHMTASPNLVPINTITSSHVYYEVVKNRNPHTPASLRPFYDLLHNDIPGWVLGKSKVDPVYGLQRTFYRLSSLEGHDLI